MNKKKLVNLLILIFGIVLGMLIYRNNWFPLSQYRVLFTDNVEEKFFYVQYDVGVPLFSDRIYHDTIGNIAFDDTHVLQIPRHSTLPIRIELTSSVEIYRFITESNDNSIFEDWDVTGIKIGVYGHSCSHTKVVSKEFDKGTLILYPGGPIASSPILIKSTSKNRLNTITINDRTISDDVGLANYKY